MINSTFIHISFLWSFTYFGSFVHFSTNWGSNKNSTWKRTLYSKCMNDIYQYMRNFVWKRNEIMDERFRGSTKNTTVWINCLVKKSETQDVGVSIKYISQEMISFKNCRFSISIFLFFSLDTLYIVAIFKLNQIEKNEIQFSEGK